MEFAVDVAQALVGNMGINLRGGNGRVAEQALHAANVRAVLQQVRGEAVAERVRADFVHNPGQHGVFFDQALNTARR